MPFNGIEQQKIILFLTLFTTLWEELKIKDKDYKVICHLTDVTVVIDDKKEYTMIPNDTYVTVCDWLL